MPRSLAWRINLRHASAAENSRVKLINSFDLEHAVEAVAAHDHFIALRSGSVMRSIETISSWPRLRINAERSGWFRARLADQAHPHALANHRVILAHLA